MGPPAPIPSSQPPPEVVVSVCRRSQRLVTTIVFSLLFVAVLAMSVAAAWVEQRPALVVIMAPFLLVIGGVVAWGAVTYEVTCRFDARGMSSDEVGRRWSCRWADAQTITLLAPLWSEEPFLAVQRHEVPSPPGFGGPWVGTERRARSLGRPAGNLAVRVDRRQLGPIAAVVSWYWGRPPAWDPEYLAVEAEPGLPSDW